MAWEIEGTLYVEYNHRIVVESDEPMTYDEARQILEADYEDGGGLDIIEGHEYESIQIRRAPMP